MIFAKNNSQGCPRTTFSSFWNFLKRAPFSLFQEIVEIHRKTVAIFLFNFIISWKGENGASFEKLKYEKNMRLGWPCKSLVPNINGIQITGMCRNKRLLAIYTNENWIFTYIFCLKIWNWSFTFRYTVVRVSSYPWLLWWIFTLSIIDKYTFFLCLFKNIFFFSHVSFIQ